MTEQPTARVARPPRQPLPPADLHLHSSRSDGTEPPEAVVRAAFDAGVRTMALTDHDTTAGWDEAREAAANLGVSLVPGIELSTRIEWRSVHLLAYLPDPNDPALLAHMDAVRIDRVTRAERMVANIGADYAFTWDDVARASVPGATIGRPHIADALIARKIVVNRASAFATILHPQGPYYVDHYSPDTFEVMRDVLAAGGVPVVAHPLTTYRAGSLPTSALVDLVDAGLAGFEVDHRENTEEGKRFLNELVRERDLIATGSSDYHGSGKPNRPGENVTRPEMVERILEQGSGTEPLIV